MALKSNVEPATASGTHFLAGKDIIVVGAGMSGLAFTIALRKQWPPSLPAPNIKIFERDTYEDHIGREGYSLSLRTDARSGGVQTLDKLGQYENMLAMSITGVDSDKAGGFCVWNYKWTPMLKVQPKPVGPKGLQSMRIRRNAVQRVLASAVTDRGDYIQWARACVNVEQTSAGKVKVSLDDGTDEACDLFIAADGAKSKIRGCLRPDKQLDFAHAVCISGVGKFEASDKIPAPVNRDWGLLLAGQGTGFFVSPVDKVSALWNLSYLVDQPTQRVRHPGSLEETDTVMAEVRERGKTLPEPFNTLINATDPSTLMVFNALDLLPFPHIPSDPKHGHIVFLGDANHAVSPFAGNGANLALMDGWDLASCLLQASSLEEALAKYDEVSLPRAQATVKMSRWTIDMAHAKGLKLVLYTIILRVVGLLFLH